MQKQKFHDVLFKVFWRTETHSQHFPTISQNTVESHCVTTTKIH